jgi:hypothetical protein
MPSHCVGFNTKVPAQLRRNQEEPEERGEKNFTGKSTKDAKMYGPGFKPYFVSSFENLVGVEDHCHEICASYVNITVLVVPAWTAGTQVWRGCVRTRPAGLDAGNPCRHDGSC